MRKFLGLMLVFTLSLLVLGTTDLVKAEATEDVTIYLHIHQYDGDYTNSGTGFYAGGSTWNNWEDRVTSTDDFGGIVEFNFTAAEINSFLSSIEFKPTRNANVDDASNYLAPASIEGKVFADVTSLQDGSETVLHLYYVEGAKDFYVVEGDSTNGLFFNVYANPAVAADENAYDDFGMHTWYTGTGGSAPDWGTPVPFEIDVELVANGFLVPMKLGVLVVGEDATQPAGFIVYKPTPETKSCTTDMHFSTADLLALNGRAEVALYEHGECEFTETYDEFIDNVGTLFEMNSGNRFVEGTEIVAPDQLDVTLLMPKNAAAYEIGRFQVKDADGNLIPILSIETIATELVGAYTGGTTCDLGVYKFVLYVDTSLDHSKLGLVGSLNGWNIDAPIMSLGDDDMGNAVFEVCTSNPNGEFKVKYDPDGDGFTWDGLADPEITPNNQAFSIAGTMTGIFYVSVSDIQVGSFNSTLSIDPVSVVKVFVDTDLDHSKLGIVGSFQGWNTENAVVSTFTTNTDHAYFEFTTEDPNIEFVILFDDDGTAGFSWSDQKISGDDNLAADLSPRGDYNFLVSDELNQIWDMGELQFNQLDTVNVADYTFTSTVTCTAPENKLVIILHSRLDDTKLGLVGSVQGWDLGTAIAPTTVTSDGEPVFEICTTDDTGEFKILFDSDDNGFSWDDFAPVDSNQAFDLGGATGSTFAFYQWGFNATLGQFTQTNTVQYRLTVYVNTAVDHSKIGLVGSVQGWDPGTAILSIGDDSYGQAIFEVALTSKTGEFKILFDNNDNGFAWGDTELSGSANVAFDLEEEDSLILYIDDATDKVSVVKTGSELTPLDTAEVTLMFAADTFVWGEEYTVEYMDKVVTYVQTVVAEEVTADLFFSEYIEGTSNNKAIELYNPLDVDLDLTDYVINYYNNGAATPTKTFDLTGTLGAGETYVICTDTYANQDDCDEVQLYADLDAVVFFNGDDALELVNDTTVIDVIGLVGEDPGTNWPVGDGATSEFTLRRVDEQVMGNPVFTAAEWNVFPQDTFDGLGSHKLNIPVPEEWIASEVLPIITSNNFVAGDALTYQGTLAWTPTAIGVVFENPEMPFESLELIDNLGAVVPVEYYGYTFGPGSYTPSVTCGEGENKLTVVLHTNNGINALTQIGLVGSLQGWTPEAAINPVGLDSKGNPVFEICVDTTDPEALDHAFKILDQGVSTNPADTGFAWGDPEYTPTDVKFTFDGDVMLYVEEGNGVVGSVKHTITLAEANMIDVAKTYQLQFMDENGFLVYIDLDIDNEAPDIQFTVKPNVDFEINDTQTFNYMNFFDVLSAIDNRDGEVELEVTSNIDPMTPGTQTFTVQAVDEWNNVATKSFSFTVLDVTDPVITIDAAKEYEAGAEEPDWTDFASTNEGTLTVNTSQVDMDSEGTFYVIYTATDASGNSATASLLVTITAAPEEPKTGCFGEIGLASSIAVVLAALGGAVLFFVRKH